MRYYFWFDGVDGLNHTRVVRLLWMLLSGRTVGNGDGWEGVTKQTLPITYQFRVKLKKSLDLFEMFLMS